jgi:hypothetical protein
VNYLQVGEISLPEDCGGVDGYYNVIEVLSDPDHYDHEDMRTGQGWIGIRRDLILTELNLTFLISVGDLHF